MQDFSNEIVYKTSRSGGKGGQNVNKVETKAEAHWNVLGSGFFTADEKALIIYRLENRINAKGELVSQCSEDRSQLANKETAAKKLHALVEQALIKPKQRRATKLPKAVKQKRSDQKMQRSEVKSNRKRIQPD